MKHKYKYKSKKQRYKETKVQRHNTGNNTRGRRPNCVRTQINYFLLCGIITR